MTDQFARWDAAYVLGSLSSADRRSYEAHLSACESCRTAVGELSGVPALLGMLDRDEVAAIDESRREPPPMRPDVLDGLLRRINRRRRRSRFMAWSAAAAAAATLVIGLLLTGGSGTVGTPPSGQPQAAATSVPMTPVAPSSLEATVALTGQGWGTHIAMTCTYRSEVAGAGLADDAGDRLAMVAVGRDGTRVQLATWMAQEGSTASPAATTAMALGDIAAVQVVLADSGTVVLQRNF